MCGHLGDHLGVGRIRIVSHVLKVAKSWRSFVPALSVSAVSVSDSFRGMMESCKVYKAPEP